MTVDPIKSTSPIMKKDQWLIWEDKLLKYLDGQSISNLPQMHIFTERLLIGDVKATFNQAALDTGIRTFDNINKVLLEMNIISSLCFPRR